MPGSEFHWLCRARLHAQWHPTWNAASGTECAQWFVVPLDVINEAVDRIRDRSITRYRYSPEHGALVSV